MLLIKVRKDKRWVCIARTPYNKIEDNKLYDSTQGKVVFSSKNDFSFMSVGNGNVMIKEIVGNNLNKYHFNINRIAKNATNPLIIFNEISNIHESMDNIVEIDNFVFFLKGNVVHTLQKGIKWHLVKTVLPANSQAIGVIYSDAEE
jgi:hypothetical protein